jgi:hypothetical protein
MKSKNIVLLPLLVFFGCSKNDNSTNANQSFDYSIEQSRSCFCPDAGKEIKLFVAGDTIADAIWLSSNTHATYNEWQRYRTIKGLYNEIERWDSSSTFQLSVTYDAVYHYPSHVSFTAKPQIVNDTLTVIIKDANISYTTWNYFTYK